MVLASMDRGGGGVPGAYRAERQRQRAWRRERANARSKTNLDPSKFPDPLLRAPSGRRARLSAGWGVAASVALHGAVLFLAVALPDRSEPNETPAYSRAVVVQIVEPPHIDLPEPVAPPPEERPVEKTLPKPSVVKKPVEAKVEPPPDPVDVPPPTPTAEPPKEPPRRIVGISLESTTTGGAGDAFAAGNTRMGQTSVVADDPDKVGKLSHTFTPPRRTSVYVPAYPASLRGKGIRGEVGLQVEIDATGHVTRVSVTRPSAHDEFNTLAVDAARRCNYEPAKVDGVPVVRSIDITVQFQPND
jgi:periplasmic protein TonB